METRNGTSENRIFPNARIAAISRKNTIKIVRHACPYPYFQHELFFFSESSVLFHSEKKVT